MAEYKTKYAIGDLVYKASASDIDRDVIKAIRITGLKGTVEYGFKSSRNLFSLWVINDGYFWRKQSEVFSEKQDAQDLHEQLKIKEDAEKAKMESKKRADRKKALQDELRAIDDGSWTGNSYDYEDD